MENRKKIAILLPWLKMGGTNKIALHFMRELSQHCDVTLILSQNTGELLDQLPKDIHLVIDHMRDFRDIFMEDLRRIRLRRLAQDILYYARIKLHSDSVDNYRYLVQRHDYICDTEFDCAISYHGQSPERLLNLLYRTHAKKKVAWIHGEFNNSPDHYRRMNTYYSQMDHMFFVSGHTLESFLDKFTMDRSKCTVYYNPIDKQEILEKSHLPFEPSFDPNYTNLLTVGRISAEKGQDMIPEVTRTLLDEGHNVRWYIVGDGDARPKVEQLIREHGVAENVLLLGTQTNPYCFMHACDIYVQPSYTEGYSTTICEAGILGKAIVGTIPSGGIRDQITHGEDGLIVEATAEGLAAGIRRLLTSPALRRQFETNIQKKNFEGAGEIRKFLAVLEANSPIKPLETMNTNNLTIQSSSSDNLPSFSVIIPVHNSANTIQCCLDSILSTSYNSLEILLIDDGSTDNSTEIILSYALKDKRIRLLSQRNAGPSSARNHGLNYATGEIITFIDSDDFVKPCYFDELSHAFQTYNSDVVFFEFIRTDDTGNTLSEHRLPNATNNYFETLVHLSQADMFGYTWLKAFKRNLLENLRFDEQMNLFEDEVFTCTALSSPLQLHFIKKPLYYYVCGNTSTLTRKTNPYYFAMCEKVYTAWQALLAEQNFFAAFLTDKANHMSNVCKYYCLERRVNMLRFLQGLSKCTFLKDSTSNDRFICALREKRWAYVIVECIIYKFKVSMSKKLRKWK